MADAGARRTGPAGPAIAVTIHAVAPATWRRTALLRDWLADHGVTRATLLVVPAPDLHPFDRRSPDLLRWLEERVDAGDEVAQHGLHHGGLRPVGARRGLPLPRRRAEAEFVGLGASEAARALDAGRRILADAGFVPRGFVAPGFAYTPALHAALRERFAWWGGAEAVHDAVAGPVVRAPALRLSAAGGRVAAPWTLRAAQLAPRGPAVRLDLHPRDLDAPRVVAAAERVLRRARHRVAVTGSELVAGSGLRARAAGPAAATAA
nr:DUF2334 domain-containing protein [Patulibacter sp. SYSU D01012]